jgi:alpha-glucosidase (family GH31 glycosyl hydrolase)/glycerophosphoryl diester phosphodiesterase
MYHSLEKFAASALMAMLIFPVSGISQNKIEIAAHRGFWQSEEAGGAQNSIASLKSAQDHSFWGSEFDVQLTSDDVVIVNHDNSIQKVLIWDNPYTAFKDMELKNGEKVSTFDEYLSQGEKSATTMLVCEIKAQKNADRENRLTDLTIDLLRKHNLFVPDRVIFISFSMNVCRQLVTKAPGFTNQYLGGDIAPDDLAKDGINGIDYQFQVFYKHPEYISQARNHGMSINSWTVNNAEDIQKMIDLGVDCITTNEPLLVRQMLGTSENRIVPVTNEDNPKADPKAVVTLGNARFTVLTPRLIRMEWAANGVWEDRASLGIVNRNLTVPKYTVKKTARKVTIKTDDVTLVYNNTGRFDKSNLSVTFTMPDQGAKARKGKTAVKTVTWHPGMDPSGNLLGTSRTLDTFDSVKRTAPVEPFDLGVASKDGWAVIDESTRQVFVPENTSWKNWVANRDSTDRQDLYMFAYGHNYTDAVSDFTKIAGKEPIPPKFALGYWWCRFWQYSDFEFVDIAKHMRELDIPIDVMVLDMDWHDTRTLKGHNALKDEFDQSIGWTGYTWEKHLFPDPANHLSDLHNLGLKTTLNLHPASGVQPYEEPYDRFVKDYLSRTSDYDGPKGFVKADGTKAPVPFRIDQEQWADAYFNSVIHPLERQGVDFWWLDWQQWITSKYTPGLSNTFWLNYTFFNDMARESQTQGMYARRPMIYHRWGGIGSHRYQIGFSGDTQANWKVLSYLPYFTSTASNVCYGYWGHDIGGHYQAPGRTSTDGELYTRWLQSAVFNPIFKTHSTKNMTMEKRFWVFPDYFDSMKGAIRLRYTLSPYIYTAAREAYDTGISICRPMYYYWSEDPQAYSFNQEFMFGDNILATVVGQPVDSVTGLANRTMWFPEGTDWYDMATGAMYKGGQEKTLQYTVEENPYYVKAGSIIPMASPRIQSLQEKNNEIYFCVVPGDGKSTANVYEDDGTTQAYASEYATTQVTKTSDASSIQIKVAPRQGTFIGADPQRRVRIILEGVFAPESVKVNGVDVPYSRFAEDQAAKATGEALYNPGTRQPAEKAVWGYNGSELNATIFIPERAAAEELTIEVRYSDYAAAHRDIIYGKKGLIKRMMVMTPQAKLAIFENIDRWGKLSEPFMNIAQLGSYITEDPQNAGRFLENVDVDALNADLMAQPYPDTFRAKVKAQTKL